MVKLTPINITQMVVPDENLPWLEIILLVDDAEVKRLSDWAVGYYHCQRCGEYQGFAYKLPEVEGQVSPDMHLDRQNFTLRHALHAGG